ncbi:hypothetical protein ACF0H2_07750 [Serratia marcescens]
MRCDAIRNKGYTHYPLTLLVLPGERLRLLMEYRDSVPQPERFAARLMALLQQWIAQPDLPLPRWQLQTPQEQALVAAVNARGRRWRTPPCIRRSPSKRGARRNASRCRTPGTVSATVTCSARPRCWPNG